MKLCSLGLLIMLRRFSSSKARASLILALGFSIALGGCAGPRIAPELLDGGLDEPYALASGDRLRVIVFGQDSLSNAYAVDASGRISIPLIGLVDAKGQTTSQLEKNIEGRLRGGYLREPKVNVEIEQYRPFFILGEVAQSGQYPYVAGSTIQTAVAIAGGFGPRAARSYAEVTRTIHGQTVTAAVPITFPLRPGDTVAIKERLF